MGFVHGLLSFIVAVSVFDTSALLTSAWPRWNVAFVSRRCRPAHSIRCSSQNSQEANENGTVSKTEKNGSNLRRVVIQQIALDDTDELERMSNFCIGEFYGDDKEGGGSLLSRKWKYFRLGAMRKAQLLDLRLYIADNRCVFVAKDRASNNFDEIIGCCEVIEEKVDVLPRSISNTTASERERRKAAGLRPVIENLCVKEEYRRSGVASALLLACENSVQLWPGHDEVFAQVGDNNDRAYHLFLKLGYQFLFADPTCTEVVLDDTPFAKEATVTKRMMGKFLSPSSP